MKKFFIAFAIFLTISLSFPFPVKALYYPAWDSPYGMNIALGSNFWNYLGEESYPQLAKYIAQAGIHWVKISFAQKLFDPTQGSVSLERTDKLCRSLLNEGLQLVGDLTLPRNQDYPNFYPNGLRTDWQKWENFIRLVIGRYGAKQKDWIHYWMIENEVDIRNDEIANDESLYLELIKGGNSFQGSVAITKEEDPKAIIITSAWTTLNLEEGQVVDRFLAQGLCDYFDIFTFNTYTRTTPESENNLTRVKTLLNKYSGCANKTIWITETNQGPCFSPEEGATEIKTRFQRLTELGVKKIFWYGVNDQPNIGRGILSLPSNQESFDKCIAGWRDWSSLELNQSFSSLQDFALNYQLPSAPIIISPTDNQLVRSNHLEIAWQPTTTGTHPLNKYVIQLTLSSDPLFFAPQIFRVEANQLSFIFSNLEGSDYLLRIKAIDSYLNHGPWSEVVSFKIESAKPGDVNNDGRVDEIDYAAVITYFGQEGTPGTVIGDVYPLDSGDGVVDEWDYATIINFFGT